MDMSKVFEKCFEKWGINAQLAMMAEESSELSVASLHMLRNAKTDSDEKRTKTLKAFAEEMADVQLMLDELLYYFGGFPIDHTENSDSFHDYFYQVRAYKVNRLLDRLECVSEENPQK